MSDNQQFKFIGQSESGTSTKVRWPLLAQGLVIRANVRQGLKGQAAFEAGVMEYNNLVDDGEVDTPRLPDFADLPESYRNKNAGSVLYGLRTRFLKRVNDGHAETRAVAEELGLIEPSA